MKERILVKRLGFRAVRPIGTGKYSRVLTLPSCWWQARKDPDIVECYECEDGGLFIKPARSEV